MPESSLAACRFPIRARTAFWRLLSGLLNIDSALTLIRFARRDDTDDLFAICFVLTVNMYYQQQSRRDGPDRMPALFTPSMTRSRISIRLGSSKTRAAVSKSRPPCLARLNRFFSESHSKRTV